MLGDTVTHHAERATGEATSGSRVLLVEDSEDDALLIARELRKGGYELFYQRVPHIACDGNGAQTTFLGHRDFGSLDAPVLAPPAALALLKERSLDIPFIIVSGCIGEDVAVAAMKAGAHDFMLKTTWRDSFQWFSARFERPRSAVVELTLKKLRRNLKPALKRSCRTLQMAL